MSDIRSSTMTRVLEGGCRNAQCRASTGWHNGLQAAETAVSIGFTGVHSERAHNQVFNDGYISSSSDAPR